jgi:Penicillin-binding protein 5, C-terminal domain.
MFKNVERKTVLNENITAPISQGQVIGEIQYLLNGELLGKANIISSTEVSINPNKKFPTNILHNWYWFVIIFYFIRSLYKKHQRKRKEIEERQC